MNIDEKIDVRIELSTLASVIAGLYCMYNNLDPIAVPESVWLMIAEKITPYLKSWDYSTLSFEDFLKYYIMIIPYDLCSDEDLEILKNNEGYFEVMNGNVKLIITFTTKGAIM